MSKKINYCFYLIITLITFASCEKQDDITAIYDTDLSKNTNIKVFNATLNTTRNYVYTGTTPLTGAAIAYGGNFPANSSYASLQPGNVNLTIKDTLRTTIQLPLNFASDFEAGKFYSIFMYDTVTSPKYKIVADQIVVPTDTSVRFRFANFYYSTAAIPNVDVFSFRANANIATNIATNDITNFINHPFRTDTFYVRTTGTSPVELGKINFNVTPTRSYTFIMRGSYRPNPNPNPPPATTFIRTMSLYSTY